MEYTSALPNDIPLSLLLEADPSEAAINGYLAESLCFVGQLKGHIAAACVVKPLSEHTAEIMNVSVLPEMQQQGIGSELLRYVLEELKRRSINRVELGTGTFGYQLTYYQRLGFRVEAIWKDHFTNHYPKPIFENGIQHRDMLRLSIDLAN